MSEKTKETIKRPDWDSMFLLEALHWAQRSHDIHTKCGCVLVKSNTILSAGYNGIIRSVPNDSLPLTRPEKYPYMIHAEQNAIFNCARNGISTHGAIAYITTIPCTDCLQYMYQCGISEVVYTLFNKPHMCNNKEYTTRFDLLSKLMKPLLKIIYIPKHCIKSEHLHNMLETINE